MNRAGRARGFSLIELITVIALMGVVSTLGTVAYFRIDARWHSVYTRAVLERAADSIFQQLRDDLGCMLASGTGGACLRGVRADYVEGDMNSRFWRTSQEDDAVVFPVERFNPVTGRAERFNALYALLRQGEGAPTLTRVLGDLSSPLPAGARQAVAGDPAVRVMAACFEFSDGVSWQRGWDRPEAPAAVRVSLTLRHANRVYEQISRKAVIPLHVR